MKTWLLGLCCTLLLVGCATTPSHSTPSAVSLQDATQEKTQTEPKAQEPPPEVEESHGVGHHLLWYIPNRISDLLDIIRARLRLGPGLEVGVRATELVDFDVGGYSTIFIGLPGPRRERVFNWPFGIDTMSGAEISIIGETTHSGDGPHYGVLEVGLGAQLLLVGFDLGVDVWEAVDFVTGLVFIDPVEDDI